MEEDDYNDIGDLSYDDGIYILASRRSFLSRHLEYRVAHISSVDRLYGEMEKGKPKPVPHMISFFFSDKPVFKTEEEATAEAMRLLDEVESTEHGIGVIYVWEDITYKKLVGG
jgi:hypothetical protein